MLRELAPRGAWGFVRGLAGTVRRTVVSWAGKPHVVQDCVRGCRSPRHRFGSPSRPPRCSRAGAIAMDLASSGKKRNGRPGSVPRRLRRLDGRPSPDASAFPGRVGRLRGRNGLARHRRTDPGPELWTRLAGIIQSVYVVAELRNSGLGSLLIGTLIDQAREMDLEYLSVHPSPPSFPFYRRLGFGGEGSLLFLAL